MDGGHAALSGGVERAFLCAAHRLARGAGRYFAAGRTVRTRNGGRSTEYCRWRCVAPDSAKTRWKGRRATRTSPCATGRRQRSNRADRECSGRGTKCERRTGSSGSAGGARSDGCFSSRGSDLTILEPAFVPSAVQRFVFRELSADSWQWSVAHPPQIASRVIPREDSYFAARFGCRMAAEPAGYRLAGCYVRGGVAYLGALGSRSGNVCGGGWVFPCRRIITWSSCSSRQSSAVSAGVRIAADRFSGSGVWDFCATQRSHPVDSSRRLPGTLFRVPAAGDGHCATGNGVSNCRRGLRCYTPGWILPGDFPLHLNRLFGRKGPFTCKFASRERVRDLSELPKHDRDCDCRWRAIGCDVWRAVGARRTHRKYL